MNAEVLHSQLHQPVDSPGHLILGHAVLGIPRHIHNGIAQGEGAARIIAQTHGLRHLVPGDFCQEVHKGSVVQVNVSPHFPGLTHILHRGHVGGKHHVVAGAAHGLGKQKLGVAGAVAAAALLLQNLDNIGVRRSLHGEILPVARIPGKSRLQCPGIGSDASLVINVEGGGNLPDDFLGFFQSEKGCLFHISSFFPGRQGFRLPSIKKPVQSLHRKSTLSSRQHNIRGS